MNLPKPLSSKSQWFRLRSLKVGLRAGQTKQPDLLRRPGGPAPLMTHFLLYTGIGVSLLAGPVLTGAARAAVSTVDPARPESSGSPSGVVVMVGGAVEAALSDAVRADSSAGSGEAMGPLLAQTRRSGQSRQPASGSAGTSASSSRKGESSQATGIKPVGSRRPSETSPDLLLQKAGEKMADALAAFAEGLAAEEEGDTERAIEAYHRSLGFDPSNIELAIKVAFELAQRGEVPQGIDILKDAEKAAPKDFLPPLCLSQLFGKYLKKNDLAEKYALRALALEPGKFPPYLALFEIYTVTKQQKKAEGIVAKAEKAASPDPMFWLQVAEIYSRLFMKGGENVDPDPQGLPKITAALEKAYEAAVRPENAKNASENAGEDDQTGEEGSPLSPDGEKTPQETLVKIADFYVLLRQLKPAIPIYQKVISESPRQNSPEMLALREKLARCLLSEGERDKAIVMLNEILKQSPARYDLYEFLGELYSLGGEMDLAIRSYQKALLIDATQPNNFLRIADLQMKNEQPEEALKTLRDASRRFARHPQITFSLALALRESKKYSESLTYFAEAEQLAKSRNPGELNGFFYFAYGVAAEQAGQTERAAELLAKSIQLDPSNAANAYNYLGYMWAEKGERLDEALQLITQALTMEPENPAFIDSLGWCYYQLGRYEEALVHLQKAVDTLEPEDSVVFEHLGDAHMALGNKAAAEEAWQRAIAIEPRNAVLIQRIRKKVAAAETGAPAAPGAPGAPKVKTVAHEEPVSKSAGENREAKPAPSPAASPATPSPAH